MRWSEIREAIRRRPGMYIGGRPDGEGAARLLLSYLVEPALRLGARRVELTVAPGPWFTLRYDGPDPDTRTSRAWTSGKDGVISVC